MKYVSRGYCDERMWEGMSESERNALMDECFTYDEVRHFLGEEVLETARNAATLRFWRGKVMITDGPYAETKEWREYPRENTRREKGKKP